MTKILGIILAAILCVSPFSLHAQFDQPFKWTIGYDAGKGAVAVTVDVPSKHYLYKQTTKVTATVDGKPIAPSNAPAATDHADESGPLKIYASGRRTWLFPLPLNSRCEAKIEFQGCRDKTGDEPAICFMPATVVLKYKPRINANANPNTNKYIGLDQSKTSNPSESEEKTGAFDLFSGFTVVRTGGGFMSVDGFLKFLGEKAGGNGTEATPDAFNGMTNLAEKGFFGLIIFILLGGLALNLTPCVLPMMPINLAIIGAGATGMSRKAGFIRGSVYGLGIAISYGALGLLAMFAGARFGALNASPWFNLAIAAVFILLALAMFDLITIDFSRYGANMDFKKKDKGAPLPAVFAMGVVSALLAGACVAPVVIAVLLYSMTEYADGNPAALLLPFLLGVGMALPWPLVGGGVASLPKPGKWMVRIKQGFGVFILIIAGYYAWLGFSIISINSDVSAKDSIAELKRSLCESRETGTPIFIDFWATWCKNCSQMERSTFQDPAVKKALKKYLVVKFQAEDPNRSDVKKILDVFKIMGLPGYVILAPAKKN